MGSSIYAHGMQTIPQIIINVIPGMQTRTTTTAVIVSYSSKVLTGAKTIIVCTLLRRAAGQTKQEYTVV